MYIMLLEEGTGITLGDGEDGGLYTYYSIRERDRYYTRGWEKIGYYTYIMLLVEGTGY